MPMGTVAPVWRQQFNDAAGNPLAGGSIQVFTAGTTTHAVVYQDQTVTVPHPWPIPLGSDGRTLEAMWLLPGAYHFYVYDDAGVLQYDDDLVGAVPSSSLDVDTPATFANAVTLGTAVYESTGQGGLTAGLWYRTDATNAYSSSSATVVGIVTADYAAGATGFVRLVGRMTKLSGLVVGAVYYASTTPGAMTNVKPATNVLQIGIPDTTSSMLLAIVVAGQFQAWTPSGGVASINGEVHIGGNTTLTGTLTVSGAVQVTSLTATGAMSGVGGTFSGNLAAATLSTSGAATLASLSVTGAAAVGGNLNVTGAYIGQGVIYPGRIDITGAQTNWYLASHASYGLYSNSGLYLATGLTAATLNISGVSTLAGQVNTQNVNLGTLLNGAGSIQIAGNIQSGGFMYPGDSANRTVQGSYFLASNPTYGLYSNTGLYLASKLVVNANGASITGDIVCAGGSLRFGVATPGTVFSQLNANGLQISTNTQNSTALAVFYNTNGQVGSITVAGASTGYNSNSDMRLKRDRGLARSTTVLEQTEIHDYDWISDGTPGRGVFSQDAYKVAPFANTPGTDERTDDGQLRRPWSTDYSKYVPDLIVGWKRHAAKIAALEAQLAALKGTV